MKWDHSLFTIGYRPQTFSGILPVVILYLVSLSSITLPPNTPDGVLQYEIQNTSIELKVYRLKYLSLWSPTRIFRKFCIVIVLHHSHYQADRSDSSDCHCVTSLWLLSGAFSWMPPCYIVFVTKYTFQTMFHFIVLHCYDYQVDRLDSVSCHSFIFVLVWQKIRV
jgi:hypothetical protein